MSERSERALFLSEFVRDPVRTASVMPSSSALAARMVAALPEHGNPVVVELGPGTGAFTAAIRERLGGRGRQLAVEVNERMSVRLRGRFPGVEVVTAGADDLPGLLAERGIPAADLIVSGLPWTVYFGGARPLADTLASVLAPTGALTQFTYAWSSWTPQARRQRAHLRAAFEEVVLSRTVWRNAPPAFVYVARRPRTPRTLPVPAYTTWARPSCTHRRALSTPQAAPCSPRTLWNARRR
ncbi:class I SAM-dependent methyltransferase [Streptomyces johnsoniae]|uniref:SAM-dependent methyltransferase n=1 Tax=Streptomyces johnsoniae TaxID=3075532 RepID=A0ABU2S4I5_9ACTN|nr:SAM-dependent methyltransferase [Streptomyces sp. DSM 41886]MDT0443886.1 SAM-dependent methyltransferase [Streptomyces sp. DSM 41886]